MRGPSGHWGAIGAGSALALDGALLSTAPSSMTVISLSAAILVAIVWLSLARMWNERKFHDPESAAKGMGEPLVIATVEFLLIAALRGYPLREALFCIGGAILTVLLLTAALARMVELLNDPRKLRRFFSQPW